MQLWLIIIVAWHQKRIKTQFSFLAEYVMILRKPNIKSEHVIFLPRLCAADGLKYCVFILSQKNKENPVFHRAETQERKKNISNSFFHFLMIN